MTRYNVPFGETIVELDDNALISVYLRNLELYVAHKADNLYFTHEEEQRWANEARKLEEEQEYNG